MTNLPIEYAETNPAAHWLEACARELASTHEVLPGKHRGRPIRGRLRDNRRALGRAGRIIAAEVRSGTSIGPAAEWLLDNFQLLDEQLREIEADLGPGYYRELPKLASGDHVEEPRVFALSWAYIDHIQNRVDLETLTCFVVAYQTVVPLTIGELWAIAMSLRIVLVDKLRRLADWMVEQRTTRARADALADGLLDPARSRWVSRELRRLERSETSSAFAARLVQRLHDHDPATAPGLVWLRAQLLKTDTTPEQTVRTWHLQQVETQSAVRDIVTSLRTLLTVSWSEVVEEVSLVEAALQAQRRPEHDLDFATRDRYRHAVEDLARRSGWTELAVVGAVAEQVDKATTARQQEPGYWLIARGRPVIHAAIGYRAPWSLRALPIPTAVWYFGGIVLGTLLLIAAPLALASRMGASPVELLGFGILGLLPASELAISLVNRAATRLRGPRTLPKLALEEGVPDTLRTLVAIPALLIDESEVNALVERLEVHYLANDDDGFRFALVTDWCDAHAQQVAGDEGLLALARAGIARLNVAYSGPGTPRFLMLHRARQWNERQQKWMGWERKRGKLHELNRLLRGATDTTFLTCGPTPGELAGLHVRYVITLDSDTRMPQGAARRLVGTLAHPLNKAIHDPVTGLVVGGYGILQPRITPALPETGPGTLTQRFFSGPCGVDPYVFATSDVYQDLFAQGSYTGKGIYDVDAFERALAGRVPENTMLSHDLFEGLYARAGLVSDVELFESYPAQYPVAVTRQHRWTRGDWQLLPWIFTRGPIGALGRWKLLDNLRRSLVPVAALGTILASWMLVGGRAWLWTGFVLLTMMVPVLLPALLNLLPHRAGLSKRMFLRERVSDLSLALGRAGLAVVLLPVEAVSLVDATVRTVYRMATGRGPMLEWVTAAQQTHARALGACNNKALTGSLVLAAVTLGVVAWVSPQALLVVTPFVLLWGLLPWVVWRISAPPRVLRGGRLDAARADLLRLTARRTWRYFETYVTAEDHNLPPDNVQEDPEEVIGHRTSPTNIGLYLLSAVAAHDMGWLGAGALVTRLEATLDTLDRLEMHRGHLFNWYDTTTLVPLAPRYVSTVDSGNLAGHLIALQQACLELAENPPETPQRVAGVADTLVILRQTIDSVVDDRRDGVVRAHHLQQVALELAGQLDTASLSGDVWPDLLVTADHLVEVAQALAQRTGGAEALAWARLVRQTLAEHASEPADCAGRLMRLAERAEQISRGMEWTFLLDPKKKVFAIGFDVTADRLDVFAYDLLASECRLASFLAIARREVPVSHWFRLGRRAVAMGSGSALVSWSGSMFEYLMPGLVMAEPEGSLLASTNRQVVARQIQYGADRGVPWGISESAYNTRDLNHVYQYGNFGLPGLGVKRGLGEDLVVTPYATALAAMVAPVAAADNLVALEKAGANGRFGFYEAVDYTAARLPNGDQSAVIKAYFAHHQGMSILALCNVLTGYPMRRRFHAASIVQATELLLQERAPRDVPVAVRSLTHEEGTELHVRQPVPPILRHFDSPHGALPATQRLSNGRYSVSITAAGSGQSQWGDRAVTRWREDETLDNFGSFIFVRDADTGRMWSAGHQPAGVEADEYQASFYEHHVVILRRDGRVSTELDVVIAPDVDAELRQVSITNNGHRTRTLDLTSYAEVVLTQDAADVAHRAFSNLFVETAFEHRGGVLLATRRPRSASEERVWVAHVSVVHGVPCHGVQFETDRARFIGRGRTIRTAHAVHDGRPLSNTVGAVLDPILSLRRRIIIAPGKTARVLFATLVDTDRDRLVHQCDVYRELGVFERATAQAWTHAQIQLHELGIEPDEAQLYQRLGSRVLYADPGMRGPRVILQRNRLGHEALWKFGISGDQPILLGRIQDGDASDLVRQLVRAHCYWRVKGMVLDLILLDEQDHSYGDHLHGELERQVRASHLAGLPNSVHVIRTDTLAADDHDLLLTVARVVVQSRDGTLAEQLLRRLRSNVIRPPPKVDRVAPSLAVQPVPRRDLQFYNGIGGFSNDGRDYVTVLGAGQWTPLPWVNVIANPGFGFVVSEAGSGFTWAENSRENALTPWSNDPVCDTPGEILYIRDDDTGEIWTPTPLPVREDSPYVVTHGQGFTRFVHESHGIALELVQLVAPEDPIKLSHLRLRNTSGRERRVTVAAYVEWVLSPVRAAGAPFVVTSVDASTGALFARNRWKEEFAERVAFLDIGGLATARSGDRTGWIGRNGCLANPAGLALDATGWGSLGPGLDPCGMLMRSIVLAPGETVDVVVTLGETTSEGEARRLVALARAMDPEEVLGNVVADWDALLDVVQVQTPDKAMDVMLNRWLLYQTVSCRLWARAGFYQAGGAYGFRDQLQDCMALCIARPDLVREHLLRAAAHQFPQGDVQHWWHPPTGKGVRTRFTDDRLWLAFTLVHYLDVTADTAVLDEVVPFIDGPPLQEGQEDAYQEPSVSMESASLYEHAVRGIEISLKVGRHGLPLIGGGDWNDGMNRVGEAGEGESVWLAWFQLATLDRWIPIAQARGDVGRANTWRTYATSLRQAVDAEGWDGDWYRRAFTDEGVALGSAANLECRIDSIAQSWAVLSGAGRTDRAAQAMASVEEHLVRRADSLILLLTPPFDKSPEDPGYIKGYVPGVRENGGQYTHAAIWVVMAFAALGEGTRAGELFSMLNPVRHATTPAGVQRYRVEPYVVAADVYGAGDHVGRGGWTWYTGSSAWMYRAGLESILGIHVRGDTVHLAPCIPASWPSYTVTLKHHSSRYRIVVTNPNGVQRGIATITLDGTSVDADAADVPLVDDGRVHEVAVTLGQVPSR